VPKKRLTAPNPADREVVAHLVVVPADQALRIYAGRQYLNLKRSDLDPYRGNRALRGTKLPRGYRNVDRLEVDPAE